MYFVKVLSKKILQPTGSSDKNFFKLTMSYDGSGRRISKTRWVKKLGSQEWEKELVTHYTGIGTEVREDFSKNQTKVVVNMPEGLGRYGIEDAEKPDFGGRTGDQLAGYIPNVKFEWYLKNHLGSTMLVYGTEGNATSDPFTLGTPLAAYDYRAFGEMVELLPPPTGKVTENFTGKEHDDEIALNYFGARYLDPMLGMWISVDPKRQHFSPYTYGNNNPIMRIDPDGTWDANDFGLSLFMNDVVKPQFNSLSETTVNGTLQIVEKAGRYAEISMATAAVAVPVACALIGVQVPAVVMGSFIAFNALSSGFENGVKGVVSSVIIDATFFKLAKILPGGALSKSMIGAGKRAVSVGAQGVGNNFSHDVTNYVQSFKMPAEMFPLNSSDMPNIDVPADNTNVER